MRVSTREIRESNMLYYFKTYAKQRTREHFWGALSYVCLMCLLAGWAEYLGSWGIFRKQAGKEMIDIEVEDWVRAEFHNGLFFLVICLSTVVCMTALIVWLIYYWKYVKSYELYKKRKWVILIPVIIAIVNVAAVFIIGLFFGIQQQKSEFWISMGTFFSMCASLWPLFKAARLLIPWEVTPWEKNDGLPESFWAFCDTLAQWFLKDR